MQIQKQNESYTLLISENESDISTLQKIHDFLKAEKPDAKYNFKVQRGWESPYTFFTEVKTILNPFDLATCVSSFIKKHIASFRSFSLYS